MQNLNDTDNYFHFWFDTSVLIFYFFNMINVFPPEQRRNPAANAKKNQFHCPQTKFFQKAY